MNTPQHKQDTPRSPICLRLGWCVVIALLFLWLGTVLGSKFSYQQGAADYHSLNVRAVHHAVGTASKNATNQTVKATLNAVSDRILVVHDWEKVKASDSKFFNKINTIDDRSQKQPEEELDQP